MFAGDQEVIDLVQEIFGYCIVYDVTQQKFFMFFGEGANRKKVLVEILRYLVGPDNVSSVGMDAFRREFGLQPTLYKLVNICTEVEHEIANEGLFKAFVGGNPITINRKFRDPVTGPPKARLVFATNNVPRFKDTSGGMERRAILIPCPVTIPEEKQIKDLDVQLREELPGIFNWAVAGRRRLTERGHFKLPRACQDALDEHISTSNPARVFLRDHYVPNPTGRVRCDLTYRAYQSYCETTGVKPIEDTAFGKEAVRRFTMAKRKRDGSGERKWFYHGIRVQDPSS